MKTRCLDQRSKAFLNYGGRGIRICAEWIGSYDAFVRDMGECPERLTLERKDVNGNYEPSNCCWATKAEQARNRRRSRRIAIDGKHIHVAELADLSGVDMRTIEYRLSKGMPLSVALSKDRLYNNAESQKKAVAAHAEMKRAETHCKRGHEFTPENTYMHSNRRACRICRRAWDKFLYYKRERPIEEFL